METRITPVKDFTAHVQSRVKKSITIGTKPRLDRCCGNCMESPKEKRTRRQGFRRDPVVCGEHLFCPEEVHN